MHIAVPPLPPCASPPVAFVNSGFDKGFDQETRAFIASVDAHGYAEALEALEAAEAAEAAEAVEDEVSLASAQLNSTEASRYELRSPFELGLSLEASGAAAEPPHEPPHDPPLLDAVRRAVGGVDDDAEFDGPPAIGTRAVMQEVKQLAAEARAVEAVIASAAPELAESRKEGAALPGGFRVGARVWYAGPPAFGKLEHGTVYGQRLERGTVGTVTAKPTLKTYCSAPDDWVAKCREAVKSLQAEPDQMALMLVAALSKEQLGPLVPLTMDDVLGKLDAAKYATPLDLYAEVRTIWTTTLSGLQGCHAQRSTEIAAKIRNLETLTDKRLLPILPAIRVDFPPMPGPSALYPLCWVSRSAINEFGEAVVDPAKDDAPHRTRESADAAMAALLLEEAEEKARTGQQPASPPKGKRKGKAKAKASALEGDGRSRAPAAASGNPPPAPLMDASEGTSSDAPCIEEGAPAPNECKGALDGDGEASSRPRPKQVADEGARSSERERARSVERQRHLGGVGPPSSEQPPAETPPPPQAAEPTPPPPLGHASATSSAAEPVPAEGRMAPSAAESSASAQQAKARSPKKKKKKHGAAGTGQPDGTTAEGEVEARATPTAEPEPAPAPAIEGPLAPPPAAAVAGHVAEGGRSAGESENMCDVCMDGPKTHAFVPCGHRCVCASCSERVMKRDGCCPFCREPAMMAILVYTT